MSQHGKTGCLTCQAFFWGWLFFGSESGVVRVIETAAIGRARRETPNRSRRWRVGRSAGTLSCSDWAGSSSRLRELHGNSGQVASGYDSSNGRPVDRDPGTIPKRFRTCRTDRVHLVSSGQRHAVADHSARSQTRQTDRACCDRLRSTNDRDFLRERRIPTLFRWAAGTIAWTTARLALPTVCDRIQPLRSR